MQYRLILADFDHTLRKSDGTVDRDTIATIKRYQEKGGHFAICTGRILRGILNIAKDLKLAGDLVASQGSVIYSLDEDKYILHSGFDYKTAAEICSDIDYHKEQARFFINDQLYVNMLDDEIEKYAEMFAGGGLHKIDGSCEQFFLKTKLTAEKIVVFAKDGKSALKAVERLTKKYGDRAVISVIDTNYIEVADIKYTKGTALKYLADKYGVPMENTIAIGDSLNDYTMVQAAGKGVAVCNAVKELKEIADLVSPLSCDEDAVGHIIRKYGLGEDI